MYINCIQLGKNLQIGVLHKPFLITDRVKNVTLSVIITDSVEITDGGCTTLLFLGEIGLPKWPPAAILKKKYKKFAHWSEMARNAIESDFRPSKMAAGDHFEKKNQKIKLRIDLKWWEIWSKVIFGHPKWPFCEKNYKKKKSCVLIWNGEKWIFWWILCRQSSICTTFNF